MYYEEMPETKTDDCPVYYKCGEISSWWGHEDLHWHEELEIMCFLSGNAEVNCDRERIIPGNGEIIIVNPYELHNLCSEKGCVRHLLLVGKKMLRSFGCENIRFRHCVTDPEIADIFDRMLTEEKRNDEYSKNALMALSTEILVRLCREWRVTETDQSSDGNESGRRLTASIMEYIDRHFTEQISVGSICDEFGYSKSYICRVFREITGLTIARQIAARRIYYAGTLLASKRYTVSECALMSGFTSASYFSKAYRKMYGRAPSEGE